MREQVTKTDFAQALKELGHNPKIYEGQKLSLDQMCNIYELDQNIVLDAIEKDLISSHYDYINDVIWVDALEAAHFYYCLRSKEVLYKNLY